VTMETPISIYPCDIPQLRIHARTVDDSVTVEPPKAPAGAGVVYIEAISISVLYIYTHHFYNIYIYIVFILHNNSVSVVLYIL
jgi:hypothetical protein